MPAVPDGLPVIDRLHEQAADHYEQALRIARATGDPPGELTALARLCHIHWLQGRYEQAADRYQQLLDLAQDVGERKSAGVSDGAGPARRSAPADPPS